ncbi:hypothetical protein F5B20DRAFT_175097 [Whalleya microplaca]|nr:hypothetical protein F5B20DRAFT_175097 [Whalleya microplaca]
MDLRNLWLLVAVRLFADSTCLEHPLGGTEERPERSIYPFSHDVSAVCVTLTWDPFSNSDKGDLLFMYPIYSKMRPLLSWIL